LFVQQPRAESRNSAQAKMQGHAADSL